MFDKIHLWSPLVLDFCLLEVYKSQFWFQYLWQVCSYFLFLLDSVLEVCTFLRICLYLLNCPFYWIGIQLFVVVSNDLLYFCGVSYNFSFFTFNFIDLSPLFFLMNLAKGLSILLTFSRNNRLVSLTLCIIFFISVSFISAHIFIISFHLLTFNLFVLLSLVALRIRTGCLFEHIL